MTTWLQSEIESVSGWLRDGRSALQIAKLASAAFGRSVTRNSVIGVVHRRPDLRTVGFNPDNRKKGGKPKADWKPVRDAAPLPTRGERPSKLVARKPRLPGSSSPVEALERDGKSLFFAMTHSKPHRAPPRQQHSAAMRFIDCLPNRCRAPLSYDLEEKPGPDMLCCGHLAQPTKPYCEYHEIRLTARKVEFVAEAA